MNFFNTNREPDFINDQKVSWWKQKIDWSVQSKQVSDFTNDNNISWWVVKTKDNYTSHVVIKDDCIIYETTSLDSVVTYIDAMFISEILK